MKIGLIGIGAMGSGMANRLLECSHDVHVRDIDSTREALLLARGATRHADPASLLARVDIVFIVVVTADQIRTVMNGPNGLLSAPGKTGDKLRDKTVFFCSTIAPEDVSEFAAHIQSEGGEAIDAPISGGPARAGAGTMSVMLAGRRSVIDELTSLLNDLSARQFFISERAGDGARAKLVNNLAAGVHLAVAAEALNLAQQVGLDPHQIQQLMSVSSGKSWMADDRMPRALAEDFEARAATRVLRKDVGLAVDMANKAGVPTPLGLETLARFRAACDAGLSEHDDAALLTYYQKHLSSGE